MGAKGELFARSISVQLFADEGAGHVIDTLFTFRLFELTVALSHGSSTSARRH